MSEKQINKTHNIVLDGSGFGCLGACFAAPPNTQNHRRQHILVRFN